MKNLITPLFFLIFLGFSFQVQSQQLQRVGRPESKVMKAERKVKITIPQNDQNVNSPLTVKGKSDAKSKINLQIVAKYSGGEQDLGTFDIQADSQGNWTSTPINLWLPEDAKNAKFDITATRSGGSNKDRITVKPPSDILLVARKDYENIQMKTVVLKNATVNKNLLESLKAAPPKLTSPTAKAQVSSPLVVKGTALKNTSIEVTVSSKYDQGKQDLGVFRTTSDASGNWQTIPINLWAPEDVKNVNYVITATQFDEEKGPSRAASVTAVPKQGQIMVLHAPSTLTSVTMKPELTKVKNRPEIKPVDLGPVKKPIIIAPTNGSVSPNGRFQIMGTGTPGHNVKSRVNLSYYSKRNKQHKNFSFDAVVDKNGIWRTVDKNYSVPKEAYDIQYLISSHQIRPQDKKTSTSDKASLTQMISLPKLTNFSYKEPDFATTGTGEVINGLMGHVYKDHVYVQGEGGPGLKIKVSVTVVRNGKEGGGRTGVVDVDPNGKWKYDAGWKYSKKIDSFIIKMTQSNPGDESDQSETVIEYRTK